MLFNHLRSLITRIQKSPKLTTTEPDYVDTIEVTSEEQDSEHTEQFKLARSSP
ncbi:MAG: hypothetical protein RI985_876 [Chloroflexota bacterium]|jgi:hypothetical protein